MMVATVNRQRGYEVRCDACYIPHPYALFYSEAIDRLKAHTASPEHKAALRRVRAPQGEAGRD